MRVATFMALRNWHVDSYDNGLSYVITDNFSGKIRFFQGEQFREEFEALTTGTPALDFSDALRVIWQEYVG